MIHRDEMISMLLDACPGFRSRWEEHVAYWDGEPAGIFNDLSRFVTYLMEEYEEGHIDTVDAAFTAVERFLVDGDENTAGYATYGLIETLQTAASNRSYGATAFVPYLKPQSMKAWEMIEEVWAGKSSLMDVIRAERGESKS